MVEFGLKLEDNKVSEWAAFYLNYDALKAILKKAKGAIKNYEEAAKKRPEDAKAILQAHRAGNFSSITSKSPMPSALSLDALESDEAPPTERTSLIKIPSVPGISEFFGSRYERALRGYLKEADEKGQQFEETLLAEQKKAVDFYYDKLGELENQLQFLIESVNDSPYIQAKLEKIEKEGGRHGSHTRTPSNNIPSLHIADLIAKFSKSSNKETELVKRQKSGIGVVRIDDVSDDEKDAEEKGKALAEADSIKRALIDQYRTAKLLHNFTILNYTGMVKIVKKHDKTLPSRKGKLKGALEPQNLFNEGKAVESLANKYEKYFANWFCDGDIRAANAQMLPKRGDGLEMDWSQLR